MAALASNQNGFLTLANPLSEFTSNSFHVYNPVAYNQTYIAFYKMQGKNSTGWDSWVNQTGDETGRPVTAGQEAATIVASWFIPQGF